jgi:rubrerythrin
MARTDATLPGGDQFASFQRGGTMWTRTAASITLTAGLLAVPVSVAGAAPEVHPTTRANATRAMHGEAFAHASYLAYAQQARRTGETKAERAFVTAAGTELSDHFTAEAALIGFVGSNAANLRDAIAGERYESTTMYPSFARQARRDRCTAAATLFTEIARDEATHQGWYQTALRAVTNPGSGVRVPTGTKVREVPVPAGMPKCSGRTLDNLYAAMHGEAFASAKYTLYAKQARATGQKRLAKLFDNAAAAERTEHFAEEAALAGLVRGNAYNLSKAMSGEQYEATRMYPSFARQAAAVGDRPAAALFREISGDEGMHWRAFAAALRGLRRP